jgi:hypothetical protein
MQVAVLFVATVVAGATMANAQDCKPPEPDAASAAIRDLNEQYIDAARISSANWFGQHMAEDAVVVLGNGRRVRKAQFIELLTKEPRDYKSLTARDVTVRVYGATVQVDATAPWELRDGTTGVTRYIDTYAWLDCRWQVISAQLTWLAKDEAM